MKPIHTTLFFCSACFLSAFSPVVLAQRTVRIVEQKSLSGTIRSVGPDRIEIEDEEGTVRLCRIQQQAGKGLALQGAVVNFPARVEVRGERSPAELAPGMLVEFKAQMTKSGRIKGSIGEIRWLDGLKPKVERVEGADASQRSATYRLVGVVVRVRSDRLTVAIPDNELIRKSKLVIPLDKDAVVRVTLSDLSRVAAGAKVVRAAVVRFDTGDWAVRSIDVELARSSESGREAHKGRGGGKRKASRLVRDEDRYGHLSDEPSRPRDVRSAHFLLRTDVSDRKARITLDRLETMFALLGNYFGRRPSGPIECYVVRDMSQWSNQLPAAGAAKIAEGAGVTITTRLGSQVRAVVYSCDKPGVVQHEAVHALCAMTFGSTGPTWYAEGIAEVGNYWKRGKKEVDVPPVVITYLRTTEPKKLADIVAPGQITGDSWQAYAWRWALCHLLMHNPNYAPRFRALGVGLMRGERGVSFESVYGPVARQLSFEYDWFTKHVDNGFRADLCAWDWSTKFRPLRSRSLKATVRADRGWQPSGAVVEQGRAFRYEAAGDWHVDDSKSVDADGRTDGRGHLEGIVMDSAGNLSTPFLLGRTGTASPPLSGRLYLRCHDDWTRIGDNRGSMRVTLEPSG